MMGLEGIKERGLKVLARTEKKGWKLRVYEQTAL